MKWGGPLSISVPFTYSSSVSVTSVCDRVAPNLDPLNFWQRLGINLVARLQGKRDVVLAIDLTESVGFGVEGELRLQQIVEKSLQSGDRVYLVGFATDVNPSYPIGFNAISDQEEIHFRKSSDSIEALTAQILDLARNSTFRNTNIQRAELYVYEQLAQRNHCRLIQGQPIRNQSVVWITDAPILREPGMGWDQWKETPAGDPFLDANSPESQLRQNWLQVLNPTKQTKIIPTAQGQYQWTVTDIAATVQELCSPAPGGKEICTVNSYLVQQLWLPSLSLISVLLFAVLGARYWLSLQKPWRLEIRYDSDDYLDSRYVYLRERQQISFEEDGPSSIECPGTEVRGYLERRGNRLYLKPTGDDTILFQNDLLTAKTALPPTSSLRFNCPDHQDRDYEITIIIKR